jgi:hypothetical protein
VPNILPDFNEISGLLTNFHNKSSLSDFTEIRPVGVALVHTDGQTDIHDEVIGAFATMRTRLKMFRTNAVDTNAVNTNAVDTNVVETNVVDTNAVDTNVVDTNKTHILRSTEIFQSITMYETVEHRSRACVS